MLFNINGITQMFNVKHVLKYFAGSEPKTFNHLQSPSLNNLLYQSSALLWHTSAIVLTALCTIQRMVHQKWRKRSVFLGHNRKSVADTEIKSRSCDFQVHSASTGPHGYLKYLLISQVLLLWKMQ